jgi:hypothetical protein
VGLGLIAGGSVVASASSASADYGPGAVYQIEITANILGSGGGGAWLWFALNGDGSVDYRGSDCGHGDGAARDYDNGTGSWSSDGTTITITGTVFNGFNHLPVTVTVPARYGHYSPAGISDIFHDPFGVLAGLDSLGLPENNQVQVAP